jgi:hypothetical protein
MVRGWAAGVLVVAVLAACSRRPQPVYEYGETVTLTSTEKDGASAPSPPAEGIRAPAPRDAGTSPMAAPIDGAVTDDVVERPQPSPRTMPAAAPAPAAEPEAPLADGAWTTTVHSEAPPPREPPAAASEPEHAPESAGAPASATDVPATPRQWYKAKTW